MGKFVLLAFLLIGSSAWGSPVEPEVFIPDGKFQPFFKELKDEDISVKAFYLDRFPVTVRNFNDFLIQNPAFRKSRILPLYADPRYLQEWKTDVLSENELAKMGQQPATSVSWFVARKYCHFKGRRLPTIAEWETAADASNPQILQQLLSWYAQPGDRPVGNIGQQSPNKFHLHDMHGLIWEWVEDFSSVMISPDSRSKGDRTDGFFCGGGSVNAKDSKEYATFMRYGFRSGLKGDYCLKNLGFRCAFDFKKMETSK